MVTASRIWAFFLVSLLLAGCDNSPAKTPDIRQGQHNQLDLPANIDWFNGTVENAFAEAKQRNKPVFLYWGAVWCPPCHELKATIFKQQAFIDQSKLFIPVYLDGDTQQAQLYAEKFSVYGYPTVIVFSPQGDEITRLPGGVDIQRYVGLLELAINAIRPVSALVAAVQQGETISPADWKLLSYYSWGQDRGKVFAETTSNTEQHQLFALLAESCPDDLPIAKSRLQMLAMGQWALLEASDSPAYQQQRADYLGQITSILADSKLRDANQDSLIYAGVSLVPALADGSQTMSLQQQFVNRVEGIFANPDLDMMVRLRALSAWVALQNSAFTDGQTFSADQLQWIAESAAWGEASVDKYQYHGAVNSLWQTLYDAGLVDSARSLLTRALTISKHPYYYMPDLGYLEAQQGNNAEALNWYKKAWDNSVGPATRTQWGVNYVINLIALSPEDTVTIGSASQMIISELATQDKGLYQRNSVRMGQLSDSLLSWAENPERQQMLGKIRAQMAELCASPEDLQRAGCHLLR